MDWVSSSYYQNIIRKIELTCKLSHEGHVSSEINTTTEKWEKIITVQEIYKKKHLQYKNANCVLAMPKKSTRPMNLCS